MAVILRTIVPMLRTLSQPIVFCDVETTGAKAGFSRITEIACIRYENGAETDRFVSLINPESPIPYNIQMITGITPGLVEGAPVFSEVADRIEEIFDGAIFCAHNVRFDYNFITAEMTRAGYDFAAPKLCTVQLSRRLFPGVRGHGLSKIIERFAFTCDDRHRALGDTEVLVQFAKHVDQTFDAETVEAALKGLSTNVTLPPNTKSDLLIDIPHSPGVYLFYDENDSLLYVGKSVNIYKRILSHFSNATHDRKARAIWDQTHHIETRVTASELGALLLEVHLIKTLQPTYNRRSRKTKKLWCLKRSINSDGYITFEIVSYDNLAEETLDTIYGIFKNRKQAKDSLSKLVKEHSFCPKLLGIESGAGACFSYQLGICSGACVGAIDPTVYNIKLEQAFAKRKLRNWPYQGVKELRYDNRQNGATELYTVDNWMLQTAELYIDDEPREFLPETTTFDYEMYKILIKYL
jgi:DNA polymerase-3 subunit epsilon